MTTGRGAEATDAFLQAIDLEIEAILMGSATDVIPLRQGTRTGKDGDDFEYVFQARSKPDVARRSLIRSSTTRGRWERATAAVPPDGKVRVTTPADLGRESANAQLREDATVPLEQLAERISAAGRPGGVNLATAGFVLGDGAPRMARWPDVERLVVGYRDLALNDRQRDAIERALACDITFIWGPPGTGKTEVVGRIVEGCVRQGLRVLFLSPTHVALDQAVERICALLEREDGFELGLVQRAGDNSLPSLQRRFGAAISPDRIVERAAEELARRSTQLSAQLDAVQAEKTRREVANTVRARCRVLGTTVQKAVQSRSLMDPVDVVVIDEAGMVALTWAWCAAGMAGKRVVVAGDFRQLPAVTYGSGNQSAAAADRQHSLLWMDRDAFTAAGLVDAGGTARPDARMVCLDTQYRMRPAICAAVNEVAYPDAPLRTGRGDSAELPGSALLPGPFVLVDTSSRRMPVGGSAAHKSNAVHEAVVHELIRGLQHDRVLPTRKATEPSATDRMAVITPYRDQATALQKSVRYRFGTDFDGFADTVHRFQGSQRPIVVVDTVAGAGDKPGCFHEGTGLSSQTCRLLNVTLSRAQDHLVVVADVDFLSAHVDT